MPPKPAAKWGMWTKIIIASVEVVPETPNYRADVETSAVLE